MSNASIIWIVVKWRIFSGTGIRALRLCAGRSRCRWHVLFALDLSSIGASSSTDTSYLDRWSQLLFHRETIKVQTEHGCYLSSVLCFITRPGIPCPNYVPSPKSLLLDPDDRLPRSPLSHPECSCTRTKGYQMHLISTPEKCSTLNVPSRLVALTVPRY